MKSRVFSLLPLGAALFLAGAGLPRASAQTPVYSFSVIVNQNQARPDGGGAFGAFRGSIDGNLVAFRSPEGGPPNSIWTADLSGNNLHKIVDTATPTPGFPGGHFTSFFFDNNNDEQAVWAKDGTVIFQARSTDSASNTRDGLYSVPEAGGVVKKLVDTATMVPGGSGPFNSLGADYWPDSGRVAFSGSGPGNGGIFSVKADGTGLVAVADSLHQFNTHGTTVGGYAGPILGSGQVTSIAGNGLDFSQGANTLVAAPATGGFDYTDLFFSGYQSSGQMLPGDTNTNYHTRLDGARIDGSTVIFAADDAGNGGIPFGFYSVPLAGGTPTKVFDQTTVLPGNGVLGSDYARNYVATGGQIIFLADGNGGTPALFSYKAGVFKRLFGAGDMILGYTPDYQSGILPASYSNGNILLITGQRFDQSLSVAVLTVPPVVTSAASATATTEKAFSYQITATNNPTKYGAANLPAGLTINQTTGSITGAPTKAGTYAATIAAFNAAGSGAAKLTITVKAGAPVITSALSASGKVGGAFSYQITATNSPHEVRRKRLARRVEDRSEHRENHRHAHGSGDVLGDDRGVQRGRLGCSRSCRYAVRPARRRRGRVGCPRSRSSPARAGCSRGPSVCERPTLPAPGSRCRAGRADTSACARYSRRPA